MLWTELISRSLTDATVRVNVRSVHLWREHRHGDYTSLHNWMTASSIKHHCR